MSVIISVVHEEKVCQCSDIELFMFKLYRLIFQPIMQVVPGLGYFNCRPYTYKRTIRVQYLRIPLSSVGEEDFRRFALNLLYSNCLWLLFCR